MSDELKLTRIVPFVRAFLQRDAMQIVKDESVKHFKQSFQDEGFTDKTLEKWPDIGPKRKTQKQKKNGRLAKILTDMGDLGNSITGTVSGRTVTVSSDLPYAKRHNDGLAGMPQRQFMGASQALEKAIEAELNTGIGKILNRF